MEENRRGLGSAPPPKPLPSVLKQAEALLDPSSCLSQDWLPQAQVPLEVKVGGSGQTQTSLRESLRPLFLSQHLLPRLLGTREKGEKEAEHLLLTGIEGGATGEDGSFHTGKRGVGQSSGENWSLGFQFGLVLFCTFIVHLS